MFRNYFQVAFRNLIKNRLFSLINIIGLSVGLAACILISLFVRDELTYDQHWANADRIFQLNTTFEIPGREPFVTVVAQGPVKTALLDYFAQDIAASTRFNALRPVIRVGDKAFSEQVYWTDSSAADMFDLEVIAGDLRQTLNDNSSFAINHSFAIKHFGRTDVIGEVINVTIEEINRDFRVGAVFRDLPHNTVLDFQALAMIDESDWSARPYLFEHWFSVNNTVFFQLERGASMDTINTRLADFADNKIQIPPGAISQDELRASDFIRYSTQAIGDIQLNPAGDGEMKATGDRRTVIIFSVIAGLMGGVYPALVLSSFSPCGA
ncbi:MAG: putative ABC transport system permease protein [Halieaceae bacterium]|jgi:putative ABC transport system permease protein